MGYTIKVALIGMILILFVKGFKWQLFIGVPAIANALVYTTMFYSHWNAWFDENNSFHSGPLKYTYMVVSAYYAALFLHAAIKMFREKNAKEALFLIPTGLIILGGVIIEAYTELKNCTSTAIALSLLIFYLSLYIIPTKYDAVTGLLNRSIYKTDLAQRKNLKAVISLDINFLKELNDTYGHEGGDLVLKIIGAVPIKVMCEHSHFCRWGGEEFLLLMQCEHKPPITAEKIRSTIEQTEIRYNGQRFHVTVSIGVAIAPSKAINTKNIHNLITLADEGMYESKKAGKNRVTVKYYK